MPTAAQWSGMYGPMTTEMRGGIVTINFYDPDGHLLDYRRVEELAGERHISLRTGCFCNPGAGETAEGITDEDVEAAIATTADLNLSKFVEFITHRGGRSAGAIRVSFGLASNFADAHRFLEFAASLRDQTRLAMGEVTFDIESAASFATAAESHDMAGLASPTAFIRIAAQPRQRRHWTDRWAGRARRSLTAGLNIGASEPMGPAATRWPERPRQPSSTVGAAISASASENRGQLNTVGRTRLVYFRALRQRANCIGHEHVQREQDAEPAEGPRYRRERSCGDAFAGLCGEGAPHDHQ